MASISFAIPKGSLEKATYEFIEKAFIKLYGKERSYRPTSSDAEIKFKILRPQEIPIYVADGLYDLGITGLDWVLETSVDVKILLNLEYGLTKLVFAVPKTFEENSMGEMIKKYSSENKILRISTEYPLSVSKYLVSLPEYRQIYGETKPLIITPWWKTGENREIQVYLSFGATEAKPPEEADAIADVSETGTTLEQNGLKPLDVIVNSQAVLVANKISLSDKMKREKIYDIVALFRGVIESGKKLHIFVNVKEENLEKLVSLLPGLKGPTISKLSKPGWYAVNTIISRSDYIKLLPKLRKLAQGLVVHEPQLIMPLEDIAREENGEV
ncbi:MAG: ATP phosphoribosyltransferase [Nitrososphaeria archaeon]|nr:ATP phosphoribosyltransferase [Nitrososphaeria archaeon]